MNRTIELETIGLPETGELIAASALLAAKPELARRHAAEEIAIAEYGYYSTQTYIFEVIGFQLLGEMASSLRHFDFVHEMASQAQDEASHAHIYRSVVAGLPIKLLDAPYSVHATPIYDAFVKAGTVEEKVVAAYFVLESIAMGIFGARQRCYRQSPLAEVDHQILSDEASHQGMGVRIVADLVRGGRLTVHDVNEIVRFTSEKVAALLVPTALFERFSVQGDPRERDAILSAGFLGVQRATSQRAILNSLRRLKRVLASHDEATAPVLVDHAA